VSLASDPPSMVPFKFSAAPLLQQPLHRRCCLHSNGLFFESHCTQNRVARPWERPGGPCLVLAIAHRLVLLNQIQILLPCCFYFLVLLLVSPVVCWLFLNLLGLFLSLLAVSQSVLFLFSYESSVSYKNIYIYIYNL
jgi:hypothetical protein